MLTVLNSPDDEDYALSYPKQSRHQWAEFANWCNAYAGIKSRILKKKFELLHKHSSSLLSVKIHMTTFPSCSAHQLPFEVRSLPQGLSPAV